MRSCPAANVFFLSGSERLQPYLCANVLWLRVLPHCLSVCFSLTHAHKQTHTRAHTHTQKGWPICLSQASGSLDIPRSISLKTDTHPISLVQKCHAIPVDVIQKVSQGPFHCDPISCACTVSYDGSISNHKCPLVLAFTAV